MPELAIVMIVYLRWTIYRQESSLIIRKKSYCDIVIDFLISTNVCILNGRNFVTNDFSYLSSNGGASVVDYCLVPCFI